MLFEATTYVGVVERIREQNEVSRPSWLVGHVLGDFLRALVVLLNADDRQGGRKDGGRRRVCNSVGDGETTTLGGGQHAQHGEIGIWGGMAAPSEDVLGLCDCGWKTERRKEWSG